MPLARNVLLVDDDEDTREILRTVLEADGFRVFEASNGVEALKLLEGLPDAFILLDAQMPLLDGEDVLRTLRLRVGDGHRVIFMTADSMAAQRVFDSGDAVVLRKPISLRALRLAIRERSAP